jgi:hypothetical protein
LNLRRFTEEDLENIARDELKARSRGDKLWTAPTREKLVWDPARSVIETMMSCLVPFPGDGAGVINPIP